jgi:signal transduction protein with GAF and PtsI domain
VTMSKDIPKLLHEIAALKKKISEKEEEFVSFIWGLLNLYSFYSSDISLQKKLENRIEAASSKEKSLNEVYYQYFFRSIFR